VALHSAPSEGYECAGSQIRRKHREGRAVFSGDRGGDFGSSLGFSTGKRGSAKRERCNIGPKLLTGETSVGRRGTKRRGSLPLLYAEAKNC